jgi:hypothetical protein
VTAGFLPARENSHFGSRILGAKITYFFGESSPMSSSRTQRESFGEIESEGAAAS